MNILIDIGGTNTRIAKTEDNESFGEPVIFDTPQEFDAWLLKAKEAIATLSNGMNLGKIVCGIPGTLDETKAVIHKTPHLPLWNNLNLKERLEQEFSCAAFIENDAALVGLGEAVYGAGSGYDIVAYITISTGVGGIRIVNGKIDASKFGFEIGHQIVDNGKELESFISGSALEARLGMPSKGYPDPELWKEVDHYTGILGANTIMYWSPAAIVFGGPVVNDLHLEEIEKEAKRLTPMYEKHPAFVRASLKSLGGLYGALALLKVI